MAWKLGEAFYTYFPYSEKHSSESSKMFAACYFFAIMFAEGRNPFYSQANDKSREEGKKVDEDEEEEMVPSLDDRGNITNVPFMYNNVDWEALQLDPILMHQLKITMDPINFQCPTYLHFVEGPAFKFQSVESKEELLASVTVQLADLQQKSANHELFTFIERESPLVTGNSF